MWLRIAALVCAVGTSASADGGRVPACSPEALQGLRLQLQRGDVSCASPPDAAQTHPGSYRFTAEGKLRRVGKAALILPFKPLHAGRRVSVAADLWLPQDNPADSILIFDAECKECGAPGNPGLRVYFRDGGLRVDRSKIGKKHAWALQTPPQVAKGRWTRVSWRLDLGLDPATGRSALALDGEAFLVNQGRTLPISGRDAAIDRVQVGVTANSNHVPVTLYMRDIVVTIE